SRDSCSRSSRPTPLSRNTQISGSASNRKRRIRPATNCAVAQASMTKQGPKGPCLHLSALCSPEGRCPASYRRRHCLGIELAHVFRMIAVFRRAERQVTPLAVERTPAQRGGRAVRREETYGGHVQRRRYVQGTRAARHKQGRVGHHLTELGQPLVGAI